MDQFLTDQKDKDIQNIFNMLIKLANNLIPDSVFWAVYSQWTG